MVRPEAGSLARGALGIALQPVAHPARAAPASAQLLNTQPSGLAQYKVASGTALLSAVSERHHHTT